MSTDLPAELRASGQELAGFRALLLALAARLPDGQPILAQSRVFCVVRDRISPAIEDLEAIAAELSGPRTGSKKGGA
jgi:hypothetical protein